MDVGLKQYLDERFEHLEQLVTERIRRIEDTRPSRRELIAAMGLVLGLALTLVALIWK